MKQKEYAEIYGNKFVGTLPMIVMLAGIVTCALTGLRSPICYWACCFAAITVGFFLYKDKKEFNDALMEATGNRTLRTLMMTLFFAGIMSKVIAAGGLVSGLVWLISSLKIDTAFIPVISFIIGTIMSTATGTAVGTVAALGPLMIPLAAALGCNVALVAGAVLSSAVFGDNLAPISDTTIASALSQQTEVGRVVRSRLKYSLIGAGFTVIMLIIFGLKTSAGGVSSADANPADAINLIFIIIPAIVIAVTFKTGNLVTSLIIGNFVGFVMLFAMGKVDFAGFAGKEGIIAKGVSGMINITVFIYFIFLVTGIVKSCGTLDAVIDWLSAKAKTSRSAELICNLITTVMVVCLVSGTATCALAGPLERNIMAPYHVARDRSANMLDGLATGTASMLPFSSNCLTLVEFAVATGVVASNFGPFDVMRYNFHGMALIVIFWISAITGWGRTYETDEQLAKEGIYLDKEHSVPIPEGAKISKYVYKGTTEA